MDIEQRDGVDQVVDLNSLPWPWDDNSVEEFKADDVLEHLYPLGKVEGQMNIVAVLKEIHRCLMPDGKLVARIPTTDGPGAWQDPTHVTYWNVNTLAYFDKNSPYAPKSYPRFSTFWTETARHFAASRDITWMQVVLVKPSE